MMKSIIAVAALAVFAFPVSAQEDIGVPAESSVVLAETVSIKVNGMVCDFCARAVEKVFTKRDEVASVGVDLDAGEILVSMNDGQTLDDDTIKSLVKKSGYAFVSLDRSTS